MCIIITAMLFGNTAFSSGDNFKVISPSTLIIANEDQLMIANNLINAKSKDLTVGEFLENVFPEIYNNRKKNLSSELFDVLNGMPFFSDDNDEEMSPKTPYVTVGHASKRKLLSNGIEYESGSRVWLPNPWYKIPYMSAISYLKNSNGVIVSMVARDNYNVHEIVAKLPVPVNAPTGTYRVEGVHQGTYPAGISPPTYHTTTWTSWFNWTQK